MPAELANNTQLKSKHLCFMPLSLIKTRCKKTTTGDGKLLKVWLNSLELTPELFFHTLDASLVRLHKTSFPSQTDKVERLHRLHHLRMDVDAAEINKKKPLEWIRR